MTVVRAVRVLLAVAGLAMLGWGATLTWEVFDGSVARLPYEATWLVGDPLVHDALVAPFVGLVGVLLARWAPRPWRAPLAVGAVLSGVLTLLAVPLLWRPYGGPVNPGLHDGDYATALAATLAVAWVAVALCGLVRQRHARSVLRGG